MRNTTRAAIFAVALLFTCAAVAQPNRIRYNNQQLYLSGANFAWVNFANDIGPGNTDFTSFGNIMLHMHDNGGNAVRWWLHTNGVTTPEFYTSNVVVGPGTGTIADMRRVLDLAWEREIGVKLCLWSFDMLRSSNSATVLARNRLLLEDTTYTRAYINNSLIPMVDSLKRHPAIIAWEIFNEPEGMSNEFGWSDIQHVPMSAIQRFINLCSGAIHRTDTTALVTSGAWSFKAMTDVTASDEPRAGTGLTPLQRQQAAIFLKQKYRSSLTPDEIAEHLDRTSQLLNFNYYSDARLIAAGGDARGTLDFYSVHYYTGIDGGNPTSISPFHHPWGYWGLTKPIVVAEFAVQNTVGVPKEALYDTLYHIGYAGALAWSWTDINFSTHADMLASMQFMWNNHRTDVDILGIGGDWPSVAITSPRADTTFASGASIPIVAAAADSDGAITSVKFYYADTVRIGERTVQPYTLTWTNPPNGIYALTAIATDNQGHQRISDRVRITVGTPTMKKYEAETTSRQGNGMTVRTDNTASGNAFLDVGANDTTMKVTWQIQNLAAAGTYGIAFGYKLNYATPKSQYINVNGVRVTTLEFTAPSTTAWYEKTMSVDLVQGSNTIQMQMFWGWMYLDYLAVPLSIVSSVETPNAIPANFSLEQNYPNPFNPGTTIKYQMPNANHVTVKVFDLLGREIATLVDGIQEAGYKSVEWNAGGVASGVYYYRIEAGSFTQVRKMMLVR